MNILWAAHHPLPSVGAHAIKGPEQVLIPLSAQAAKAVQPRGAFHG